VRCRIKIRVQTDLEKLLSGVKEPEVVRVVVDQTILAISNAARARDVIDDQAKYLDGVLHRGITELASCKVLGVSLISASEA
jgi:uncharacterized protein YqfA (UPF0365 family)